ncbi:MAG TPA: FHA domain-containing protein [Armatimonadota bacterium]|nr:FHA domain-containing protein [Armatimonadota bacterium]
MDTSNFPLWLAWALFGSFMGWLLWNRYLPAVLQAPALPKEAPKAAPAWLFCEEGTTLDKRVRWFALRPGGRTVVGARPRSATTDTTFVYLTAEDIQEDHVQLVFNPASARYEVEPLGTGAVLHNNEPLSPGTRADLADGDTLDLGRISRFRFTLTGPESA